jgi:type IV secretion system protein TrbL
MPISAFRIQRLLILLPLLLLLAGHANAAITNEGIFDNVLNRYATAAVTWANTITDRASWLFWVLVMISMVWTFGLMALRKADIAEFFAEFIKFIVFTGFFWWLLLNGPNFAIDIIESLGQIAAAASGSPGSFSPSSIVDIGFEILFKIYDNSSRWEPVDSAAGILIGIAILVLVALIAVNMLILLISAWILAYAGVFFLGFGGSRWTSDMAINYFRTVLSVAAQLFTMVLLVGIGKTFVDQYKAALSEGINLNELSIMLVVLLILFHLVNKVPPMIGQLPFGGGTGPLGNGFGGGTALAATAVAGAAMYSAAKGFAGGSQAISAAYSKASAAESAGGGTTSTTSAGHCARLDWSTAAPMSRKVREKSALAPYLAQPVPGGAEYRLASC